MADVLVIGAGPAGMSAALELLRRGCSVTIVDDQPSPGGRIFAAIEGRVPHGPEDRRGGRLAADFRASGGRYVSGAEVWQIETGPKVFLSRDGVAQIVEPDFVIMATGAQERPMPFTGWQLPGVMTVGSAQVLLKVARQIPDAPVWLAGSGPLLLLYMHQLLAAGGKVAGILDTTPKGSMTHAAARLPGALTYGWRDLVRGLRWQIERRKISVIRHIVSLEASGSSKVEHVKYSTADGDAGEIQTRLLLVHDGVVPATHGTFAAGCDHHWNPDQRCFEPTTDAYGRSSVPEIFLAGDGATVLGARAAEPSGRIAAIGVALAAGKIAESEAIIASRPIQKELRAAGRFRRLVDTIYPPVELAISDEALVCRCEEVTAGTVRASLEGRPRLGTDGIKIATRAGMGPCQGRQCGASLARIVAEVHDAPRASVDLPRIRPPLKPLTLGELAALDVAS